MIDSFVSSTHVETIKDVTLAFRVEFKSRSIDDFEFKEIGNADSYTMNMHILNIDCKPIRVSNLKLP